MKIRVRSTSSALSQQLALRKTGLDEHAGRCRNWSSCQSYQLHDQQETWTCGHFGDNRCGFENGFEESKNDGFGEGCESDGAESENDRARYRKLPEEWIDFEWVDVILA